MKTSYQVVCASVLVLLLGCGNLAHTTAGNSSTAPAVAPLTVTFAKNNSGESILNIKVVYQGKQPIEIFPEFQPWYQEAMIITAVSTEYPFGIELKRHFPHARWVGPKKRVHPGDILEGTVVLGDSFDGFNDALSRADVLIFWSYESPKSNPLITSRISGHLQIPRVSGAYPARDNPK